MELSDFNKTDYRSLLTARTTLYSDIDLFFGIHPISGDVTRLTDIDAIKKSVRNLVLTNYNERPFKPSLGGNITALLFEPADRFTAELIKDSIRTVINRYEPRVDIVTIDVIDDSDRNAYDVSLTVRIKSMDTETPIDFSIRRYR